MNDLDYIVNTMKQGCNEVGFIPFTTIDTHYIARGFYKIQRNRFGLPVGYILHGVPRPGGAMSITQAIIDYDRRNLGFGESAVKIIVERAKTSNCRLIKVRCAADLESNAFWLALGFQLTNIEHPENKRKRDINIYVMDLWPRLFR